MLTEGYGLLQFRVYRAEKLGWKRQFPAELFSPVHVNDVETRNNGYRREKAHECNRTKPPSDANFVTTSCMVLVSPLTRFSASWKKALSR